jgi:flagellar motor switch protein FliN/FliY
MAGADPNSTPEVAQSDIDAALAAGSAGTDVGGGEAILAELASAKSSGVSGGLSQDDLAALIATNNSSGSSESWGGQERGDPGSAGASMDLPDFNTPIAGGVDSTIDLLSDVELNVKIELGRTDMLIEDVLRIGEGSVVELDKLAGDPVDVLVNDRLVARGEILVLNDNFCVRISEIIPHGAEAVSS